VSAIFKFTGIDRTRTGVIVDDAICDRLAGPVTCQTVLTSKAEIFGTDG